MFLKLTLWGYGLQSPLNDKFTQYEINWREHIQRMDAKRLPKKKLITNLKGEEI